MPHQNTLTALPFELGELNACKYRLTMTDCAWVFVRPNLHRQQPKSPATNPLIIVRKMVRTGRHGQIDIVKFAVPLDGVLITPPTDELADLSSRSIVSFRFNGPTADGSSN